MREVDVERISDSAKNALKDVLEEECIKITKRAFQISKHANRKTIIKEDILLAKDY